MNHRPRTKTTIKTIKTCLLEVILEINRKLNYSVSQKNIPDIFSCNSRKHCRIFIMFDERVTEEVSNQQML